MQVSKGDKGIVGHSIKANELVKVITLHIGYNTIMNFSDLLLIYSFPGKFFLHLQKLHHPPAQREERTLNCFHRQNVVFFHFLLKTEVTFDTYHCHAVNQAVVQLRMRETCLSHETDFTTKNNIPISVFLLTTAAEIMIKLHVVYFVAYSIYYR